MSDAPTVWDEVDGELEAGLARAQDLLDEAKRDRPPLAALKDPDLPEAREWLRRMTHLCKRRALFVQAREILRRAHAARQTDKQAQEREQG